MDINELYRQACAGDADSEAQLFQALTVRFSYFVRQRIVNKQNCEEVVQDTLKSIFEHYRSDPSKDNFTSWAYRILENKIIDFRRKSGTQKKYITFNSDEVDFDVHYESDPRHKKALTNCLKLINKANRQHARLLVLKYLGFEFEEICRRLKITRSNAYTMLSRARRLLQTCLKKGDIK